MRLRLRGLELALAALVVVSSSRGVEADGKARTWRKILRNGPVFVHRPPGYDPKRPAIVLYVHGLYIDVGGAWREHRIPMQFEASSRNAILIAPEAPAAGAQAPHFPDLADLLDELTEALPGVVPAQGPIVAAGHSGAYRTIVGWLDHPRLEHVILVDGLYGNEEEYGDWLAGAPNRRLTLTVLTTGKWVDVLLARFPTAVRLPRIPTGAIPTRARQGRLVTMGAQWGHMEQITRGRTLPVLLRMTSLPPRRR